MIDDDRLKAQQLEAWLMGLNLPPRVINPLRRDLGVVLGKRDGVPGKSGGLAGLDRAGFEQELYRAEGGAIRRLPAVGALVIETLREAIPRPHHVAAAPSPASPADEGWREFEIEEIHSPAHDRPPIAEAPPLSALSAAPAAAPDQAPAPPRRRGRPRKTAPTAQAKLLRPQSYVPAAAIVEMSARPPAATDGEVDELQLRELWRELHPQGRRAVLGYISELLIR